MLRAYYDTTTEAELFVNQATYILCVAALEQRGQREQHCVNNTYEYTLQRAKCVTEDVTPKAHLVVDSEKKDWFKFQNLVKKWRAERGVRSSINEAAMMLAYQEIIGMGENAVPLIIAQLKSEDDDPDQWFWALRAITGENPVKTEDQGNFRKMAQVWLQWAEREVYVRQLA